LGLTREAALKASDRAVLNVPEIEACRRTASRLAYLLKIGGGDIQS
jgi:hypothetical protein